MTSRIRILDSAASILRDPTGPRLSLESAARASGLSKPGLMYHFPTKSALVRGVLEHVVDRWEESLLAQLDVALEEATVQQRLLAYVRGTLTGADRDAAQLALYAEHYDELGEVWRARMEPWVRMPDDLPEKERGRLEAARLAADGAWIAIVTGILPPQDPDALLSELERMVRG